MTITNPVPALRRTGTTTLLLHISVLLFLLSNAQAGADPTHFPSYPSISPNVAFWEKIYSTHSVDTATIHDKNDLSRVYTTITLADSSLSGARKKNDTLLKKTKKHYANLLLGLARKKHPETAEEKRLAALFGKTYSPSELKRAAGAIRAQTGLKERFTKGVIRSGAYMRALKRIFKSHNIPEDLAYLPHVESSFNPDAFSKFGATGMWQFTHSTGKEFLRIDYIIDERRDPLISAEAAAKFLKRNYLLLGSWPLALTAYNYGPAGMKRALKQEGSYEKIFKNYRKGHFKFASRNFYSEFLAAVKVAKQQEQSKTITLKRPVANVAVKLPAFTDAAKLSAYLRIDQKMLMRYNPSLRKPVFEGTKYIPKGYTLKLPSRFKSSTLISNAPATMFKAEQKRSKFYKVRPGDTAGAIAMAHKISLSDLSRANKLNRGAMIRVGQNLRIPPPARNSAGKKTAVREAPKELILSDSKKSSPATLTEVFKQDSTVSGNLSVTPVKNENSLVSGTIEVQPDESIGIYADWLMVTPESIRLINTIPANNDIHPGQRIILDFLNVSITKFEETRFDFHQETQEDFFDSFTVVGVTPYTIELGDTLWDICHNKFDLPLWLLKKYNDSLNLNRLELSSNLQIPILREI